MGTLPHTGPLERGNACQCPGSPATASQAAPAPTGTTIMHLIKNHYGSSARSIRAQEGGVGGPVVGGKEEVDGFAANAHRTPS